MKISSRVDYALSCILRIADKDGDKMPVTVGAISEKEGIEPDYVERLCVTMKRAGILKSIRGKAGGYILAEPPADITAKDVLLSIEKSVLMPICFRKNGRRKKCAHIEDCKIRFLWEKLRKNIELSLDNYTLENLVRLRRKEKNW